MQPAGQPKQSKKDNKGQLAATAPTLDSLVSKRKATDESDPKSGESGTKAKMTKISVQYTQPFDPAMIGTSSRQLFSQEQLMSLDVINFDMTSSMINRPMPSDVAARLKRQYQGELEKMRELAFARQPRDIKWVQPLNSETGLTAHQWLLAGWTHDMEMPMVKGRILTMRRFTTLSNIEGVSLTLTFDQAASLELAVHAWAPDHKRLRHLREGDVVDMRKLRVQDRPANPTPNDGQKNRPIIEGGSFLYTALFNKGSYLPLGPVNAPPIVELGDDEEEEGGDVAVEGRKMGEKEVPDEDDNNDDDDDDDSNGHEHRPMRAAKLLALQRLQIEAEAALAVERELRRDREAERRQALRQQREVLWHLFNPGAGNPDQQPLDEADWHFYAEQSAESAEYMRAAGFTQRQIARKDEDPLPPAQQRQLMSAVITLQAHHTAMVDPQCPACLDQLIGLAVIRLKCGHIMCADCASEEAKKRRNCPLCRKPLAPLPEDVTASSS